MERDPGSFAALIDDGYGLRVHCEKCGHDVELDLVGLAAKYGRETNFGKSVLPKMKCGECGAKKIGTRLIAPGTSSSGY